MKNKILVAIISVLIFTTNLFAQYPTDNSGKNPFVQIVKDIKEAVVNITVEYEISANGANQQLPFNDDFFKFFFPDPFGRDLNPNRKSTSMGSGFIFKRDKDDVYIITNNHVVDKGKDGTITVTLADKAKYEADIIGLDVETDLAVIKITVEGNEHTVSIPLGNSDEIEIADWVMAIGNPFGQLGLERTVTVGVISATGRANLRFGKESPIYQDYIQTDAAINPGNSGGPLVNLHGEVIGVNAAITSTSGGNVGIGFAIPANIAKKVSSDIIKYGEVRRAYMGILPQDITTDIQKSFDLEEIRGVLVAKVEEDTPAEKAGLKRGDVIIQFNGKDIPNMAKFRLLVANSEIDTKLPIKIIRDKKEKLLTIKLTKRSTDIAKKISDSYDKKSKGLGLEVEELDSEFARRYKTDEKSGVIVSRIYPNSPASNSGLNVGDIILEINRHSIDSIEDFKKYSINKKNDTLLLYVKTKSGTYLYIPIKLN